MIEGYGRRQGIVFRPGDRRFRGGAAAAIDSAKTLPDCRMVNRNQGSGTRILIDRLLAGFRPAELSSKSPAHNAVAAAVIQRRADWGVAIRGVAEHNHLGFLPLGEETLRLCLPHEPPGAAGGQGVSAIANAWGRAGAASPDGVRALTRGPGRPRPAGVVDLWAGGRGRRLAEEDEGKTMIENIEQLEESLSRPTKEIVETMTRLEGDLVVLGVGGKIGPTLARMARRARPGDRAFGGGSSASPASARRACAATGKLGH